MVVYGEAVLFKEPVSEQLTSEQRETSEKEKSDVVWGF